MDRNGNLYLTYSYNKVISPYDDYENRHKYSALMASYDEGRTWELVTTDDFVHEIDYEKLDSL